MTQSNIAPKASYFWDYFLLESSQPHIAHCNDGGGKIPGGATKLNNGGMMDIEGGGWSPVKNHTIVGRWPDLS